MPKIFTSEKQKIGKIGENIAKKFLVKHNFSILETNYTRKWGEIDIIAEKNKKLFFVEVKSVTCETVDGGFTDRETSVYCETGKKYRPEENMHPWKLKRLSRTIQTYLLDKDIKDTEWQIDLITVLLDIKNKKAKIKRFENLIF